jgi:hypothetical protein
MVRDHIRQNKLLAGAQATGVVADHRPIRLIQQQPAGRVAVTALRNAEQPFREIARLNGVKPIPHTHASHRIAGLRCTASIPTYAV